MDRRLKLHQILLQMGASKVYFQPPENIKLDYPCIIYRRSQARTQFADNEPHIYDKRYQIIVIDSDPDSGIPDKIAKLPKCIFDRHYTAGNLNHDVFNIFY